MEEKFKVILLPDALEFINNLEEKTRDKILYNIKKSQWHNDNEIFKKLNDSIWEFRTLYKSKSYRLFAFWDKDSSDNTVIGTHFILKKTDKTPTKEIARAEDIRKKYLINK